MKVSILSYPNESILAILNYQNVSMTNGSKNMAYFKKTVPVAHTEKNENGGLLNLQKCI